MRRIRRLQRSLLLSGRPGGAQSWCRSDSPRCGRFPRKPLQRPSRRPSSRSEEHTSELQSLMRNSYAVFCLKKKKILAMDAARVGENGTAHDLHPNDTAHIIYRLLNEKNNKKLKNQ